jgi:hypothetical protein
MGDGTDKNGEGPRRRLVTPTNEVPVLLPWSTVLARTEDIAVLLLGARLYTTGIEFDISVRAKGPGLLDLHSGAAGRPSAGGNVLCFGVEGTDGFAATNVVRDGRALDDGPSLMPGGGGGSYGTISIPYLLHPVPPSGPVTVWVAWPARGLDETSVGFDGSDLGQLVARVAELWPEDPDATWPPTPPAPNLPAGGWFAAHANAGRQA